MCPTLLGAPLPPFSDLFILKELRKRILDLHIPKDIRTELSSASIWCSEKTKVGVTESGAIFYTGSVQKNRSKVNKKARGLGSPRSELYMARYSLKDDLRNELQVKGLARAEARSAVEVADGVKH